MKYKRGIENVVDIHHHIEGKKRNELYYKKKKLDSTNC